MIILVIPDCVNDNAIAMNMLECIITPSHVHDLAMLHVTILLILTWLSNHLIMHWIMA